MRPYNWKRTITLWLVGGILLGAVVAGVVLLLSRGGRAGQGGDIEFELVGHPNATSGPYEAILMGVSLRTGGAGPERLRVVARIQRIDGRPVEAPHPPWPTEEMAIVIDGRGEVLSEGESQVDDTRTPDGGAYELRRAWPLTRELQGPLYVTLRFPGEVLPDAARPLGDGEMDVIVQAAAGWPSVLVRSVEIVEESAELSPAPDTYLVIVFADVERIRGSGPLPDIRIAISDQDGQRMDDFREWVQDAAQPDMPPDLCRAYPIADRNGPFVLELTADETYREGLIEFAFEPIAID
jgi:hypothetical protein